MARPRTLPDSAVFAAILHLMATQGEKGVAFAAVARATGLAGASLVQRYGSLPAMLETALSWGWDELTLATDAADAEAFAGDKGPQGFLKALAQKAAHVPVLPLLTASQRSARLRDRAADWHARVEAALTARLHDPARAAIVFAAWQGQMIWGDKGFRLKDVLKRLA